MISGLRQSQSRQLASLEKFQLTSKFNLFFAQHSIISEVPILLFKALVTFIICFQAKENLGEIDKFQYSLAFYNIEIISSQYIIRKLNIR